MQFRYIAAALAALATSPAWAHCGGAFCAMNTSWDVQGVWDKPGIRLDLRGEFVDLDQLRRGSHKVGPSGEVDEHDETRTLNRNFVATLDWNLNPQWGLSLRLPVTDRSHEHVGNHEHMGETEQHAESWKFSGVGDAQVLGRYAFYQGAEGEAGVRFGLKLPTGDIDRKNGDGEEAERSLQPGTGSTDALLGLYYHGRFSGAGWFVQGMWQQTVHERDDYRPGRQLSADIGLNYAFAPDWSLLLQLNVQHKGRDSGANAESADSGGDYVFLSPGISYRVTRDTQIYAFFQQPLYQHVNGTQLTADWSAALGASFQF